MKTIHKVFVIFLVALASFFIMPKQATSQAGYVSFQVFYNDLSPYGQWVSNPQYGYVWFPDAGPDFAPYSTGGRWIFTEYGWTWISDYRWGWAPFHYGRWAYDDYYGWFWIPGNEWGPAWVNWRQANGYYGWAPLAPGVSIRISFDRGYDNPHDHWFFVRDRDFERDDIHRYCVDRHDRDRIIRNSTVINNTYIDNSRHSTYISGPSRDDVQRNTGRGVRTISVKEYNKPGQELNNDQLRIYRPRVEKEGNSEHRAAPPKVMNVKELKPPAERNAGNQQQRKVNPAENTRQREGQPNSVKQRKDYKERAPQPAQQRKVNPGETNKSREKPPTSVKQHNNIKEKAQPAQQPKVNQRDNIKERSSRPSQQKKVSPTETKRGREKQPSMIKSPNKERKNQPKQDRSGKRKKK